jgi:peptide deformylase
LSLQIIHYPHPTLRHVSRPLKRVDAELKDMIAEMFELMYEHDGVGLAANQVDLPYRVFIANPEGDPSAKDAECVFINPVIVKGAGQHEREEGCLSIPGVFAPVVRKETISVQAYNLAGEEVSGELDGLLARVVQHELDHLDGRLFIDRLTPLQLADISGQLEEFEIDFNSKRAVGEMPSAESIASRIAELERLRT